MIHPQALAPDAERRVQCPVCLGHKSHIDRRCVPRLNTPPSYWINCKECDGEGWLYESEAEAVPDHMRAET